MKSDAKAKEAGDDFWEGEARNPRVTAASLIVPKEIARELFHPDGRIADKHLETIQYRCYCRLTVSKLSSRNPANKVCDRIVVNYSYPTKNHHVMLRLFNDVVQQCANSLRIASRVKVYSIMHKPAPPTPPTATFATGMRRAKSAHTGGFKTATQRQLPGGDVVMLTDSGAPSNDSGN